MATTHSTNSLTRVARPEPHPPLRSLRNSAWFSNNRRHILASFPRGSRVSSRCEEPTPPVRRPAPRTRRQRRWTSADERTGAGNRKAAALPVASSSEPRRHFATVEWTTRLKLQRPSDAEHDERGPVEEKNPGETRPGRRFGTGPSPRGCFLLSKGGN